ncbi:Wzz/FepE/Etk N-terminal domain-containing protein [Cetobacterium somerae]|uniref:Wzz/FepE/Etk N-terminal domain-containing protein n=1 Tax=Cetobacterium somerae TaxID=188913 RepID=UPI002E7AB4AC|nr:Wzz/FepE/Etk N-terminal domain-containing protein [Cetobacterium somerae]WVJ00707.1 Wzz/FepE/Etk N-terminal domain-containing protein [Cetobacterium somerae]
MNKELKVMEPKQYDDEIDLYELIEILVRHKWSIVLTTILCTMLSLGGALYVRSKTPNYLMKSILIQQEDYGLKGVNKINIDTILLQDKNVKRILEIEPIKAEYLENTPKEKQNIASERKFLQEIITISKNDKNPKEISIKIEILADENSSKDIINTYIDILREQDNLADVIKKEKALKSETLEKTRLEVENIQSEILTIFTKDRDIRALKPEERMEYIASKYPDLNLRKSEQEKYYNTYVNELIRLDSLNDKIDSIKETTDIYFLKGQSKAKLILVVGIVMGLFLGIIVAFLKEFIDGYERRYKK